MREIGYAAILVAFVLAVAGAVIAAVVTRRTGKPSPLARSITYAIAGLLSVSTLAMIIALVTNDFSVSYVAMVGSRATPVDIKIISLWSALEGSILFWGWVLSIYSAAVVYTQRRREDAAVGYATATLLGVSTFFLLLLAHPANPFALVNPVPPDGPGPNPLLQNHYLMAVHPPLLYLGYVGMTVPFAFAIGALASGKLDNDWSRSTRRWTVAAWTFLSAAIVAGMWWSYEVLGWGGYWAWDPVENASFMPWLTATAFIHSTMVEERRGMLKAWNVSLIVATFLLTLLGTFLTRSGVITSVHAFAEGPIGMYFLGFIAVALVFSLALLAGRAEALKTEARIDAIASRETTFLFNNLLLTVFTFTVLLGTLFPLVAEAVRGVKVSVGAPFFNRMTVPIIVALIFLMGVGPALPWRKAAPGELRRKTLAPMIAMVLAAIATLFFTRAPYVVLGYAFVAFALVTNVQEFVLGTRARMRALGENVAAALGRLMLANPRRYGGYLAHIGVLAMAFGVIGSSVYLTEREWTIRRGQSVAIGQYGLRYAETWGQEEPHRFVVGADLVVSKAGLMLDTLRPKMNFYTTQQQPIPTPAVRSTLKEDLYLTLMAFERDGSTVTVKAIIEPTVAWVWIGGLLVMLGGFFGLLAPTGSKRPRGPVPPRQAVAATPASYREPAYQREEEGAIP
ncbi:MAG TPA: heme lyase CcmF/NrfE family subunit [Gemmatimonadaceae bacterium]|nr:heme lyase CcmF/NrfE family subunit [Gemmatimonadaceae bacterium]